MFVGSQHPKNILFDFENKITDSNKKGRNLAGQNYLIVVSTRVLMPDTLNENLKEHVHRCAKLE